MKRLTLTQGDMIGVFAPSSRVDESYKEKIQQGQATLEGLGFKVLIHPQSYLQDHQSAGTTQDKIQAFHDLLKNPDVKAIMGMRGGNRACYMLEHIDWDILKAHPKLLIGFSDFGFLLSTVLQNIELQSIYGPLLTSFSNMDEGDIKHFNALIKGEAQSIPLKAAKPFRQGTGEGILIGGTVQIIQSLIGTKHLPNSDGKILFLEDYGMELSHFDRTLWHLKEGIPFKNLKGIIFGNFSNFIDTGMPYGFTFENILKNTLQDLDIPIITNAPFGHGRDLCALPFGTKVTLESTDTPRLSIVGSSVTR